MGLQEVKYWFEDLQLREKLEENQSIVLIAVVGLIVFSLSLVVCQLTGGGAGSYSSEVELVYFDTESQTIRVVDHKYPAMPQSPLEGTENVFLASVYACEECPKGKLKEGMTPEDLKANGMFIAWLEKVDPNISEEMAMFGEGYMYRTLENDKWYKATDRGYEQIVGALYDRCPTARICLP